MRTERFRAALLSILIIASLMTPVMTLLSVAPASAQLLSYLVIEGSENSYNKDYSTIIPPEKVYEKSPPIMAAKRIDSGSVVAAGLGRMCNGGIIYPTQRWVDGELDVLFDVAFRWMKPDNEAPIEVLWYGTYREGATEYNLLVYNYADRCSWLIDSLRDKGYEVDNKYDRLSESLL